MSCSEKVIPMSGTGIGTHSIKDDKRPSTSLPLFYDGSDLCTLSGARTGMECMPLRSPPGPYHYHHVVDQTKSLQELQNEVGALLEFRDLVIETFPDLKNKMASSTASSTITGIPSSSLASRREWEPGKRVRRKLAQKENSEISSSSLIRSRSNSHSGSKKEPKSGEGNGSVIQDSGFSTETSSSKEAHSASSTSGAVHQSSSNNSSNSTILLTNVNSNTSNTTVSANTANNHRLTMAAEDELWNLLDVIHRKSNRLREEVEHLQSIEKTRYSSNSNNNNNHVIQPITFNNQMDKLTKEDIKILRKERDHLIDKVTEMEAETISGRIRMTKMEEEINDLNLIKKNLEEKLNIICGCNNSNNKQNINFKEIKHNDIINNDYNKSEPSSPDLIKSRMPQIIGGGPPRRLSSNEILFTTGSSSTATRSTSTTTIGNRANSCFSPVIIKPQVINQQQQNTSSNANELTTIFSHYINNNNTNNINNSNNNNNKIISEVTINNNNKIEQLINNKSDNKKVMLEKKNDNKNFYLGYLDGIVSSPNLLNKIDINEERNKITAILLETNIVELQRHLITLSVHNQYLQKRLENGTKSKLFLIHKLDMFKDDVEDLKFQLEEKNIELEGTKAQLRLVESKNPLLRQTALLDDSPEHSTNNRTTYNLQQLSSPLRESTLRLSQSQISTPSMKAMIPLAMDEILQNSSSTESAQDQSENRQCSDTPKRRPSKIPLAGCNKNYTAPKPPTGRNISVSQRSPSGPLSNKSLNKSTSSLLTKYGPSSITTKTKDQLNNSFNRSESAQSWRKDNSLNGQQNNSNKNTSSSLMHPVKQGVSSSPTTPITSSGHSAVTKNVNYSPLPKAKRDSLTSKVRNLDSLSRMQTSSPNLVSSNTQTYHHQQSSTTNIINSSSTVTLTNSKKDLSSSFSTGQTRDRNKTVAPIRRVSSASVSSIGGIRGINNSINSDDQQKQQQGGQDTDNGKNYLTKLTTVIEPTLLPPQTSTPLLNKNENINLKTILLLKNDYKSSFNCLSPITTTANVIKSPEFVTETKTSKIINSNDITNEVLPARDLIREYLSSKTRLPPPIFNTPFKTFTTNCGLLMSQQSVGILGTTTNTDEDDLAYKHPNLLIMDEQNNDYQYIDDDDDCDNSINLLKTTINQEDNIETSLIIPNKKQLPYRQITTTNINNHNNETTNVNCHLIGKVNPNIIKTWEQLNAFNNINNNDNNNNNNQKTLSTTSITSDCSEQQSYVLFYRKPMINFLNNNINNDNDINQDNDNEIYKVNHIVHNSNNNNNNTNNNNNNSIKTTTTTTTTTSTSDCDYYDSIESIVDDLNLNLKNNNNNKNKIKTEKKIVAATTPINKSIDNYDDDELNAGEIMAECSSIEKRKIINCWSIDSDN